MTDASSLPPLIPLKRRERSEEESFQRVREFTDDLRERRTIREFSDRSVDPAIIRTVLEAANTAPSGANKQPWTFVVVSDPAIKREIRRAAEAEEKENYEWRMPAEWLEDLAPFRTDWRKEFLEVAPYVIVVFAQSYGLEEGAKHKHYYVQESVGIAVGMLIAAAHRAGLAMLTHTPSPMGFLSKILERPENERPFLLIPIGYPADTVEVPDLRKKSVDEVSVWR